MKICDGIDMLSVTSQYGTTYPLVLSCDDGMMLIDTHFPGCTDLLIEEMQKKGYNAAALTYILLTHQDVDHIGCVKDLKGRFPKIRVLVHKDDAKYINGSVKLQKMAALEERFDSLNNDERIWLDNLRKARDICSVDADELLDDGQILLFMGGIDVIHTPGHTEGHICLFIRKENLLDSGDALPVENGSLVLPYAVYTPNMVQAKESLRKLLGRGIDKVVSYHGGFFGGDADTEIKNLLA